MKALLNTLGAVSLLAVFAICYLTALRILDGNDTWFALVMLHALAAVGLFMAASEVDE